jgi:MFS family permease
MRCSFGLGSLSLILPIGRLYSLYNAKHLYLGFLTTFILGSTLCGAAWTMNTLIIGRVLAGAGGIGVYTGIMTILTATIDVKERPVYLGAMWALPSYILHTALGRFELTLYYSGLFWSIGRILGPLIGGALGKTAWRWGFYINLIVCALFTPVYIYLLPNIHPLPGVPPLVRLRKLDALGGILSIIAIVSLFTGVNFGGTRFLWNSATIIAIFTTAGVALVLFAFQQGLCFFTSPKDRLFPVKMLFIPEACLIFVISASSSIAGFVPANFISLYFQFSRGDSALMAALRLLPMIFAMSLALPLSGYLMPRIGYLEFWPIVGSLVALPGMILMGKYTSLPSRDIALYWLNLTVLLKLNTNPVTIYISEALIGAGMGTYIQIGYTLILPYIPKSETQGALAFIIICMCSSLNIGEMLLTYLSQHRVAL